MGIHRGWEKGDIGETDEQLPLSSDLRLGSDGLIDSSAGHTTC